MHFSPLMEQHACRSSLAGKGCYAGTEHCFVSNLSAPRLQPEPVGLWDIVQQYERTQHLRPAHACDRRQLLNTLDEGAIRHSPSKQAGNIPMQKRVVGCTYEKDLAATGVGHELKLIGSDA